MGARGESRIQYGQGTPTGSRGPLSVGWETVVRNIDFDHKYIDLYMFLCWNLHEMQIRLIIRVGKHAFILGDEVLMPGHNSF